MTEKRQRVPFSGHRTKLQLSVQDQKGFEDRGEVPRWISDQDGRIQQAEAAGYTFAKPDEAPSIGQYSLKKGNSDLNGKVSMVVSKNANPPIIGFLMKQKIEDYLEDQASKELRNQMVDDALRKNKAGDPGGVGVESAYVPSGITLTR